MATMIEVEQLALTLPEEQRAILAANLLDSLTGVTTSSFALLRIEFGYSSFATISDALRFIYIDGK